MYKLIKVDKELSEENWKVLSASAKKIIIEGFNTGNIRYGGW